MPAVLGKSKWLLVAALFAFCVAPTFISYKPYLFGWDDADYLARAIAVSRAFWSGDINGLKGAMVSQHPPAMTLLGLPWGPLVSWDAASKCFITLAGLISFLAALSLYLLLRIGVKPFFLATASVCVCSPHSGLTRRKRMCVLGGIRIGALRRSWRTASSRGRLWRQYS